MTVFDVATLVVGVLFFGNWWLRLAIRPLALISAMDVRIRRVGITASARQAIAQTVLPTTALAVLAAVRTAYSTLWGGIAILAVISGGVGLLATRGSPVAVVPEQRSDELVAHLVRGKRQASFAPLTLAALWLLTWWDALGG